MLGFWSTQGFLFAMEQGWKKLPLFVIFLISLKNAYGFKGGAYSNAYNQWGQPSDNTFLPHAFQSFVSEVPVTGTLPGEVGSSLFTKTLLKRGSRKQFTITGSTGTQERSSSPFNLQGRTTYGGSLNPQGSTSPFAPGSSSSYPSLSLSSTQGAVGQSATVQTSRKQFTSSYGTVSGSSTPFGRQESKTYGGSLQPQDNPSQFASGSSSSYPSVSLSSPQGASSQSATVQSSRKQFTSSYGSPSQSGSSTPFSLQGSTTYGGSPQAQAISQFTPASPSSFNCNCVSLSSPQDVASVSATVQSLQKQFTSSYDSPSQSGSSTPFSVQGSTTYGGSLQPQATKSQFAPASPSYNCHCVSLSSPQDVASQSNQAIQSYSLSQSQKSQRWKPSQGIQTSGGVVSQGSSLSQSSPIRRSFSSLSSAGGSLGDSGQFVSAQDGSTSYGGLSQSLSSKYTPQSNAKLGYPPLSVTTSNQRSNGLYGSDSLRTQGLLGVAERTSRLSSQAPSDSPIRKKISERFVTLQRLTGSNRAPSLGLSAQASSVGMFSGIPQTVQALHESGSGVQLYNQPFLKPLLLRQSQRGSTKTAS